MKKFTCVTQNALYITIVCFLLTSFGCSPAPSVNPTSAPSATATWVPAGTDTPVPTLTAPPSATPSPTATPTPLVEDLGQVIFSENFDDDDYPFHTCGAARLEAGMLIVDYDPEKSAPCGMFSGGIYGIEPIPPEATVVVLFKTTSDFNIGLHAGDYNDETIRRFTFGLSQAIGSWDLGRGSEYKSWRTDVPLVDSWYYCSIKRSANGDVEAKLWRPENPENGIEFRGNLGAEWGTLPLTFVSDFKDVPFFVDEYQILK